MNKRNIRPLKANEIECKVGKVTENGCQLLLYKTARTDMDLLDETFGAENWECEYKEIKGNLYCGIRIYFGERSVIKWDCGIESAFGDKEKGEASDAMKRAGFKWGIGRSLYTAPFIWINAADVKLTKKDKYFTTFDRFSVAEIEYNENHEITYLKIKNDSAKKFVYQYGNPGLKLITNGTVKQINLLATQYAELAQKTPNDIYDVLKERYQFTMIENLSDHAGLDICKQLTDWIVRTKQKHKAG